MRCACLLTLAGCYTSAATPPASPPPAQRTAHAHDHLPPLPAGAPLYVFTEGTVHAYRQCVATAAPEMFIEMQSSEKPPQAVSIELVHGPGDAVPRQIAVGDHEQSRCYAGCSGTVWIDAIQPGKLIDGHIDLHWNDGHVARQRFTYPWRGGVWEVQPCPSGPDAYPAQSP